MQAKWIMDAVFNHLVNIQVAVKTPEGKPITISKYYNQAWNTLRDIRDGEILNHFPIFVSDLSSDLIYKLLDSSSKDAIIAKVVENIFKNSNLRLYEMVKKKGRGLRYHWIFL